MKAAVDLLSFDHGIKHFPCVAHSLNLVLKNGITHCKDQCIHKLLCKVKNLVSFFHQSPKASQTLNEENKKLLEPKQMPPIKLMQSVSDL